VRCSGVINAPDRDSVYTLLKKQGIRPASVTEAPGLFNKIFGKGKRWIAIAVLALISIFLAFSLMFGIGQEAKSNNYSPMPRHQVYGDPAFMDSLERDGYKEVVLSPGDRVLVRFAIPGRFVRVPSPEERMLWIEALSVLSTNMPSFNVESDRREIQELRRIILDMRLEYKAYLANGVGTPETFLRRLFERQNREMSIRERVRIVLKDEKKHEVFEQRNEALRRLGLATVPFPSSEMRE
jgi:hypothetical protein